MAISQFFSREEYEAKQQDQTSALENREQLFAVQQIYRDARGPAGDKAVMVDKHADHIADHLVVDEQKIAEPQSRNLSKQ